MPCTQLPAITRGNGAAPTRIDWTFVLGPQSLAEPPADWLLPFQAAYDPFSRRAYFAGSGGTIYYVNNPDSAGATVSGQLAFFGLANYQANSAAYDSSVFIDTPLTIDNNGNLGIGTTTLSAKLSLD